MYHIVIITAIDTTCIDYQFSILKYHGVIEIDMISADYYAIILFLYCLY